MLTPAYNCWWVDLVSRKVQKVYTHTGKGSSMSTGTGSMNLFLFGVVTGLRFDSGSRFPAKGFGIPFSFLETGLVAPNSILSGLVFCTGNFGWLASCAFPCFGSDVCLGIFSDFCLSPGTGSGNRFLVSSGNVTCGFFGGLGKITLLTFTETALVFTLSVTFNDTKLLSWCEDATCLAFSNVATDVFASRSFAGNKMGTTFCTC